MSEDPHVTVSFGDPFLASVEDRRADRRLRGRLVAPVTVWTAGPPSHRVGLTVSSVLVAEGEPPEVLGLVDPLSELRRALERDGTFLVHVLDSGDRRLAAAFAGEYPVDPFEGLALIDRPFGPVIAGPRSVISCRLNGSRQVGYQDLIIAVVEGIEIDGAPSPLAHYRGRYRTLAD